MRFQKQKGGANMAAQPNGQRGEGSTGGMERGSGCDDARSPGRATRHAEGTSPPKLRRETAPVERLSPRGQGAVWWCGGVGAQRTCQGTALFFASLDKNTTTTHVRTRRRRSRLEWRACLVGARALALNGARAVRLSRVERRSRVASGDLRRTPRARHRVPPRPARRNTTVTTTRSPVSDQLLL